MLLLVNVIMKSELPLLRDLPICSVDPKPYGGINIYSPIVPRQSFDLLNLCKKYGSIQAHHRILEFGCGTGRVLSKLVGVSDHCSGIDICPRYVKVCLEDGLPVIHIDVNHPEYNPNGMLDPLSQYAPFNDKTFDRVICIAVMNHQNVFTAKNIISEILRVTKIGGIIVMTAFLYNQRTDVQRRSGDLEFDFNMVLDDWGIINQSRPFLNCVLGEATIRDCINSNGGQIVEPIYYGSWRNIKSAPTGHDLIIIRKIHHGKT